MIKKLITVASLALATVSLKAAPLNFQFVNTNALFLTNAVAPGTVSYLQVYNPGTNTTLYIYDNYTNSLYVTNAAYTNYTVSVGTTTNIYTNIFGVLTTNIYPSRLLTEQDVAASTTTPARVLYTIYCPSNVVSTVPITADAVFGLYASNWPSSTNITISMSFLKRN